MTANQESIPHIRIFIGLPLEHQSEHDALRAAYAALTQSHCKAHVFANFNVSGRQVDLAVFTETTTLVIEAKEYTQPIRGGMNGPWEQRGPYGAKKIRNAYDQALGVKNALRDEMRKVAQVDGYPNGYQNGTMVPQSDIEAVQWFKKAADQGDAKAQFMMGNAYLKGRGTICDDVEAVKWYQKASDQGSAEGQFGLAMEYHLGHGVIQNDVEAYFWLSLSAQGNESAVPALELVRQKLTVQQLKDVRERVKQWKTKHES